MPDTSPVRESFRRLLLPTQPDLEECAVSAAAEALDAGGLAPLDQSTFLETERGKWQDTGAPDELFARAVRAYLGAGDPRFGDLLAGKYFEPPCSARSPASTWT